MPIYEYACEKCGKVTEKLVSISSASEETECPECKGKAIKIMSASAFHLKGGGWYSQGYSNDNGGCPAKSSKEACKTCPAASS
ncbi:regulatory protein, FmdB family [Denitrovibrio acetiphilus DSM 12809]|uniref:Regulatory protein, FmdB family n=1 Tax=Denitrovibrio acetiphilus (strain DSM 12809 / NBRC 114555 / N2460) TaxID=522772 RepID=D4H2L9_DENA2|nr:zinc ribbon domain-containing protein [Denitrovibrio acetiphilus]ADD67080.1 regulatory protein, FmdB family [Denitrovibrio acetiphilus DSM 12809]